MVLRTSLALCVASLSSLSAAADSDANLLLNADFSYHAFANHRLGEREAFQSHNVAHWNTDAWGDITVVREAHVDAAIRPSESAGALVRIPPGKRMWQFFTLPEARLAHGDVVSLIVGGRQAVAGALRAHVKVMKLDSEGGTWKPTEFGMSDKRTFPRQSRGELVVAHDYAASSDSVGAVELRIENATIVGQYRDGNASHSDDVNTIGLRVEFENMSESEDVWVWSPSLCRGEKARFATAPERQAYAYYRHIPRTMQKLWKGEAIHVLVMGSSIDRASANPPIYLYDEDPNSETFKQPLSQGAFDPALAERPDLDGYIGDWRHYFSYAGRLRLELMRKFNLPANKICLNFMACDGSCV
ncbi:MAG: hypothetical protein GY851_02725, partial [bacterium]|nr:hypothetical protein [bacterium]